MLKRIAAIPFYIFFWILDFVTNGLILIYSVIVAFAKFFFSFCILSALISGGWRNLVILCVLGALTALVLYAVAFVKVMIGAGKIHFGEIVFHRAAYECYMDA